jgi:hypothetical protein
LDLTWHRRKLAQDKEIGGTTLERFAQGDLFTQGSVVGFVVANFRAGAAPVLLRDLVHCIQRRSSRWLAVVTNPGDDWGH